MNNSIKTKLRLSTAAGILFAASLLAPASADTLPDSSNLELWLNADTGVTTSGGTVTEWADQSGNGNNATQTNVDYQPTLVSDAINGNSAISFNGTSSDLNITNSLNLTSGMSIFIVAENATDKNYNGLFTINSESAGPAPGAEDYFTVYETAPSSGGSVYTFVNRNGTGEGYVGGGSLVPAAGSPYIYNYNATSTSASMLLDNAAVGSHGESGYLPTTASNASIGNFPDYYTDGLSDGILSGDISEIIVYNTELSTADQTAVYNYLDAKYLETETPEPSTSSLLMLSGLVGMIVIYRGRRAVGRN